MKKKCRAGERIDETAGFRPAVSDKAILEEKDQTNFTPFKKAPILSHFSPTHEIGTGDGDERRAQIRIKSGLLPPITIEREKKSILPISYTCQDF